MGPILNGLIKLQSVENRLRAAKATLNRCRRNVIIQENQIRSIQSAIESKKEAIQLTKIQADRLELELKTRDEQLAKLRASLNLAKTNKEYAAVLTQLNTTKADSSKFETQALELMKDIEQDEATCAELEAQITDQKQKLEQIRKEAEVSAVKHQEKIDNIQTEWHQAANSIPAEVLEVFNRVADTYDGEAIAQVEAGDEKQTVYTCGGCFMGLTAETANLLMTKDEVIRCPNCTRILVLEQQQQ